jgi:hypothetical protein
MSILVKISANDAAVESILRTAASTEGQINLLKVAARCLEATTVLCRYVTSVHADFAAEITFPSTFSPTS